MVLGDLPAWPPSASDDAAEIRDGIFRHCEFVPRTTLVDCHLLLSIEHLNKIRQSVYWHPSEVILRKIEATLKHMSGVPVWQTRQVALDGAGD